MELHGRERNGVLPNSSFGIDGWANNDLCRVCGMTGKEIEALNRRSDCTGEDALVVLCREHNLASIDSLLIVSLIHS
jgi:hypothetical protein